MPEDQVYLDLKEHAAEWADHGIQSVKVIGDANAPAAIAWATYAGHRYAEELEAQELGDALPLPARSRKAEGVRWKCLPPRAARNGIPQSDLQLESPAALHHRP